MFAGLILALQQFGTKSFADGAEPPNRYASHGVVMPDEFGKMLRSYRDIITLWPDSGKFFYPDGVVTKPGEQFREPLYAKTLRELVQAEKKSPREPGGQAERGPGSLL